MKSERDLRFTLILTMTRSKIGPASLQTALLYFLVQDLFGNFFRKFDNHSNQSKLSEYPKYEGKNCHREKLVCRTDGVSVSQKFVLAYFFLMEIKI